MNSLRVFRNRVIYLFLVARRVLNLSGYIKIRRLRKSHPTGPDIIFVAATADFQRSVDGAYVPDKLDFWRKETISAGLSSMLVIMPFSRTPGRQIPPNSSLIESLLLISITKEKVYVLTRYLLGNRTTAKAPGGLPPSAYLESQIWLKFLSDTKPKLLMGIGLDDTLLATCRTLGIRTVEFQHGIFRVGEPLQWWSQPSRSETLGPDLFMTWDEHYTKIASSLNIRSLTIGYPHFFPKKREFEGNADELFDPSSPLIVVTLSCRLPGGIDPWGIFDENMDLSIIKLLQKGFRVRLRLHPAVEGGRIHRALLVKWIEHRYQGVEISLPSRESILTSMLDASINLTIASSTILEASYLGLSTLVLEASYLGASILDPTNELHSSLPEVIRQYDYVRTTNFDSILDDVAHLSKVRRKQFRNPLDVNEFQKQTLKLANKLQPI